MFSNVGRLAEHDVPILHVCGSIDPILEKFSLALEAIYLQFGGRISTMIKEGAAHHPHSLRDPGPIADFITMRPDRPASGSQQTGSSQPARKSRTATNTGRNR
jgi:hypothetical protein